MLTALNIPEYPYFDLSEIIVEHDLLFKPLHSIKPLKAGNKVPDFIFKTEHSKWQQFVNGAVLHGPVLFHQLINRPLVISFYSSHWKNHGIDYLKQLNSIQAEIKSNGGNLLIIGAEKEEELENISWKNSFSLNFYFDNIKEIAEKFSIYSDNDPTWNRFSGIDANVPLLATYVLSASGQIEYDHTEKNFEGTFAAKDIIAAVQKAASYDDKIRNINESVLPQSHR